MARIKHRRFGSWPNQRVLLQRNHPRCKALLFDWMAMPGGNQAIQNNQSPDMAAHYYMQTIGNSPLLWVPCPYGFGVGVNIQGSFGDRLSTLSGATFDLAAPLTVQAILMSPNPTGGGSIQTAVSKESNGSSYGTIFFQWNHTTSAVANAWRVDTGGGSFNTLNYASGPTGIAANVWADLICTIDAAGNGVCYRDGVLSASGVLGVPAHGTNQILVGYQGNLGDAGLINLWAGYISILRFWGRALANHEVRDVHTNQYAHYARM